MATRQGFPHTVLRGEDGLLPSGLWVVSPEDRSAFTTYGDTVVTHGGATMEEVVVPFVEITRGGGREGD